MKYIIFLFGLCCFTAQAQELDCRVTVSAPQTATKDKSTFQSLEQNLQNVLNTTDWINEEYEENERIKVNIQVNIIDDNVSQDNRNIFKADIQIQARRPVYGSDYETALFSFVDKGVVFNFDPFQPLQKSINNYVNGTSSLITYYAFMILAMDKESFENQGGSEEIDVLQEIINTVPGSDKSLMKGWDNSTNNSGRFWVMENLINSRLVKYREGYYLYHRKGLDLMSTNPEEGRKNIIQALAKIRTANDIYFNSILIQIFANDKRDEIIEIFKAAKRTERQQVYELMIEIDKTNTQEYNVLNS